MNQNEVLLTRTVSLVFLLILGVSRGNGAMDGGKEFVLDFQNPKEVRARAIWNDPDRFNFTEQGFGWDGPDNASRTVMIESTTLLAVGWSWRPVHAVHVTAKIEPPGEFKFRGTSIAYPSGALYARYSPDAKHWSSWMNLQIQIPKDKDKPQQAYKGTLRVPYKEQEVYRKLLREYSRLDVPWSSDEEAAVEWMLKNDAELFQKSLPFIGYVQFLFEIHLRGGQRIRRIHISAGYGTGGLHSLPRDKDVKKTHSGPWRFKAERRESIEPATAADGEDAAAE
jgi:hypothetical protein